MEYNPHMEYAVSVELKEYLQENGVEITQLQEQEALEDICSYIQDVLPEVIQSAVSTAKEK